MIIHLLLNESDEFVNCGCPLNPANNLRLNQKPSPILFSLNKSEVTCKKCLGEKVGKIKHSRVKLEEELVSILKIKIEEWEKCKTLHKNILGELPSDMNHPCRVVINHIRDGVTALKNEVSKELLEKIIKKYDLNIEFHNRTVSEKTKKMSDIKSEGK